MNLKKLAPLVIALGLGLYAAKMAFDLVQRKQAEAAVVQKRPQVVLCKQGVDAGAVLTEDDVVMGEVSSDVVPDTVFRSMSDVVGRVAVVPLIPGQAISTTLLAPRGAASGLQAAIPMGMRAVTMEINEVTGVAGYITPGCHVDLLQTMRDDKTGESLARTICQNVKVSTVGVRHNPQDGGDGGGRSATLLVTPQQAELIELASMNGRPRLSLRSANDLSILNTHGVTLAQLRGQSGNQREMATPVVTQAVVPTTQPVAPAPIIVYAPDTRPSNSNSDDDQWTVQVVKGDKTETKFNLHHNDGETAKTDTEYGN